MTAEQPAKPFVYAVVANVQGRGRTEQSYVGLAFGLYELEELIEEHMAGPSPGQSYDIERRSGPDSKSWHLTVWKHNHVFDAIKNGNWRS